jgi:hypothetical protein
VSKIFRLRKAFGIILVLCILLSGCTANKNVNDQLQDDKAAIENLSKSYENGYVIWGVTLINDSDKTYDDVIYLDSVTDNLHITITTRVPEEFNGELKFLWDYQEIEYAVNGKTYSAFPFHAKAEDGFEIPVNLPGNIDFSQSHILTVVALPNSDKHRADGFTFKIRPLSKDYEIVPQNGDSKLEKLSAAIIPETELSLPFSGLMLNQDFDSIDANSVKFPNTNIEVSAGERIKLAYRVGNYETAADILFYVFVGNSQYEINGGSFIHLTNTPGKVAYGIVEITAPTQPGQYEVTGFVTSAPYEHRNKENATYSDCATGFTITVK